MKLNRWSLAAMAFLVTASVAMACTIPVFRYALERWELTPYEVVVYHTGPLPADTKAYLAKLERGQPAANLVVKTLEIEDSLPKAYKALFEKYGKGQPLPWAMVRAQDAEPQAPPAWTGTPNEANLAPLIESPARQKLIDRLSRGETATFMLLSSDDPEADEQAYKLLDKELARLATALELPKQSDEGPQLRTGLPLKVSFSILRLNRADPAEQGFLKILFSTEDDLEKVKGPIVLPVFGRGRLLCSLYGKDIERSQIANVARFLCGECSCQVKELNPGVDLLIAANWHDLLEKAGPPATPRPDRPPLNKNKKQ